MTTTLDFIRHGEPEGGRLYRGAAIDDPLSDLGWQQMWQAVGEENHWERIISSPLKRCHDFARVLGEKHQLPVTVEQDFREVGFGSWEGHSPMAIQESNPEEYAAFYADPVHNRPRAAENLFDFGARVADAFDATANSFAGQRMLAIVHAGVIRAVLGYVMQAPPAAWYRVQVNNAGISRFVLNDRGRQLVFHNLPCLPD